MGEETRKFLRFQTDDGDRLVRLEHIVECLPMVQIDNDETGGDPRYRGLLHYRGDVLPVFAFCAPADVPLDPDWFLIVVDDGGRRLALVARDVYDIEIRDAADCRILDVGDDHAITVVSFDEEVVRVIRPETFFGQHPARSSTG